MTWHTVVIAVLALALACDLYLRGRALLKAHGGAGGRLTWNENRKAFYELAGREFERARRYAHPFTLGYFDLDDYTEVAERFSPVTAEGMLGLVAESARRSIRASDVVARLGGDSVPAPPGIPPCRCRRRCAAYSSAILIPSKMNCTAIAHSTSPMSRVRIRMPVWPSCFSTRGAAASVTYVRNAVSAIAA